LSDLTLAQAKKKGAQALKEAKELVQSGQLTARQGSREIIDIYWGIRNRLGLKARVEFDAWFKAEHEKAARELGAKWANARRR
jgi:hypothetical protein